VRSLSIVSIVGSLVFLVACGGSGTPSGVPITVSLAPSAPQTINAGATLNITATVANDSTNSGVTWTLSGVGSLTNITTTSVTYNAPASVSNNTVVTVTATSKVSSATTASLTITVQSLTKISLSLLINNEPGAPQTVNQGGSIPIVASLKNDSTSAGVTWSVTGGTLSAETTTSVTFDAPASVASAQAATVTATSKADSSVSLTLSITVYPAGLPTGGNVAVLNVNGGPAPPYPNGVFTSVLICAPGSTTTCQTVSGILVDTGSIGLRILASQIPNIIASLPAVTYSDGSAFNECIQFLDGSFLWGQISQVDVRIAGEVASGIPAQIIANPTSFGIPTACSNGGTNEDSQLGLSANGIIGVGPEPFDCGPSCDPTAGGTPPSPLYYASCTSSQGCQPVFASCGSLCSDTLAIQQVTQPDFAFTTDNNGVALQMPALASSATSLTGALLFGIGTQTNNGLGSATVLTLDSSDEFTTSNLQNSPAPLTSSFIDSGSNGLFFPNWPNLPACSVNTDFFCPSPAVNLSVTNIGVNTAVSGVNFTVDDADTLINTTDTAYNNLAGPHQAGSTPATCSNGTGDCIFDFGFPFFYGRTVFTAIDTTTTPAGMGPFFAY
jgi:hypothetical protein